MRAVSLHPDVIVVTSALLQVNCTIVRGPARTDRTDQEAEALVIDSPVLPEELELLPSLILQSGFPSPSGLLATHGDWDHLLGRLAFPTVLLGAAESTAGRLAAVPGASQRELRDFDEDLYLDRPAPLALGSVQGLPVPGRCGIGEHDLELHPAAGHTIDGMSVWVPWAHVLAAGDYLSPVEIPTLGHGGDVGAYLATLERLRPLVERSEHVVPGHGPVIDRARALRVLEEDLAYLSSLVEPGPEPELPAGRRTRGQRRLHAANVSAL